MADWQDYAERRLDGSATLRVERRQVPHPNPKRVNHQYRFTVEEAGRREQVPWTPTITDLSELGYRFEVVDAAVTADGYFAIVFRTGRSVSVNVVDQRRADGRPDLHGLHPKELLTISDFDGPSVKSATFTGTVAGGDFTVHVHGTATVRGEPVPAEVASATLMNNGGKWNWVDGPKQKGPKKQ